MVKRLVIGVFVAVALLASPQFAAAQFPSPGCPTDLDGNGASDFAVFRPSENRWFILQGPSYNTAFSAQWGAPGDITLPPCDFDGDGRIDLAVYRPSPNTFFAASQVNTWYFLQGGTNFTTAFSATWGTAGDTPVVGDFDGDGRTDIAQFRPSENRWYVLQQGSGTSKYSTAFSVLWGTGGDVLVPADYDGDNLTDVAVYRPSEKLFYVLQQGTGTSKYSAAFSVRWGEAGDILVPGDYDGDGKGDIAVYRPSPNTFFAGDQLNKWYILQRGTGYTTAFSVTWGAPGDIPLPGDWDGDGLLDVAQYRPSERKLYVMQQGATNKYSSAFTITWGTSGDRLIGRRVPEPQATLP